MKLHEAAARRITRLVLLEDGKRAWNPYSFGDITVFNDGSYGLWMNVYDPCGSLVCGNPAWTKIPFLTMPVKTQPSVGPDDEFEEFVAPADMDRFPGCPPVPGVVMLHV
jgi:hypothetical protein